MLATVRIVKRGLNPKLGLEGVLLGNYAFYHCSSVVFYSGGGGVS